MSVSDRKIPESDGQGGIEFFTADVKHFSDFYPYGMILRDGGESVRYSFQDQEVDDELKENGNSVNYKYRMHDPRVGRFFAVDPLAPKYPHNSPYAFSENRVIDGVELEGLEVMSIHIQGQAVVANVPLSASSGFGVALDIEEWGTFHQYAGGFGGGAGGSVSIIIGIHLTSSIHDLTGWNFTGGASYGQIAGVNVGASINWSDDLNHGYLSFEGGGGLVWGQFLYAVVGRTELHDTYSWELTKEVLSNAMGDLFGLVSSSLGDAIIMATGDVGTLKKELAKEKVELNNLIKKFNQNIDSEGSAKTGKEFENIVLLNQINSKISSVSSLHDKLEKTEQIVDFLISIQKKVEETNNENDD